MRSKIVPIIVLLVIAGVVGGGYWYFSNNPAAMDDLLTEMGVAREEDTSLTASGFIEMDEVKISPEVSGQIILLTVDEGDAVEKGQTLVEFDRALLEAEITEAEAAIATAEANLEKVKAGAREEDIAKAQAALLLAEAQAASAHRAWQDAILLRENQQELDLEIEMARTQVAVNELAVERAVPLKDAAELSEDLAARWVDFVEKPHKVGIDLGFIKRHGTFRFDEGTKRQASADWNLQGTYLWQAWISLEEAQVNLDAARSHLDSLLELRNNPQALELAVKQSEAEYKQASAAVPVAQANVDVVKMGATDEQIAVFEAQVQQAKANMEALKVKMKKYTIYSPIDGQLVEKTVHEGEVVVQGATLMTLANIDTLDLVVYVPEPDVGRVDLDQDVEVYVDTFPDRPFMGKVVYISNEAEFTPKNVQTKDERANTVFAVRVKIPNPEHVLRPGMPADVVFVE